MAEQSLIEWTDATWQPVTGCNPISAGCQNCYAARLASGRLRNHLHYRGLAENGKWTGEVRVHPIEYDRPREWKKGKTIFVCSMSDLFHIFVPRGVIDTKIFPVMKECKHHRFLVLTKRPDRMLQIWGDVSPWPENIWLGTSIESDITIWRLGYLLDMPSKVRFVSFEPLLGPIKFYLREFDMLSWVIIGGESGSHARKLDLQWVRDIRDWCARSNTPLFVKQLGTAWARRTPSHMYYSPGSHIRSTVYQCGDRKGADMKYWPEDLRIREYPE